MALKVLKKSIKWVVFILNLQTIDRVCAFVCAYLVAPNIRILCIIFALPFSFWLKMHNLRMKVACYFRKCALCGIQSFEN